MCPQCRGYALLTDDRKQCCYVIRVVSTTTSQCGCCDGAFAPPLYTHTHRHTHAYIHVKQDELHKLEKQHREQLANADKEDERQKSALHDRFARNEVLLPSHI